MKEIKGVGSGLKGLTTYSCDEGEFKASVERFESGMADCKANHGDEWWKQYLRETGMIADYDVVAKRVNKAIYAGACPFVSDSVEPMYALYETRMRQLYGNRYDELKNHAFADVRVVDLLLQDAVNTGKWKELPDELQDQYFDLIGRG